MSERGRRTEEAPPRAEWVLGALGLLAALALVVFLSAQALGGDEDVIDLRAEVTEVRRVQGGWAVDVEVHNDGGRSAEVVIVRGEISTPDGPEEAEVELDYVPGSSAREATLTFTADPRRHDLQVRPVAWRR